MPLNFIASKVTLENDLGYYEQNINEKKGGNVKIKLDVGINKSKIAPGESLLFKEILNNYYISEPLIIFNKK